MNRLIIKSDKIILPSGLWEGYLTSENGKITALTNDAPVVDYMDVTGYYVSPGFIDMHVHGGGGFDFMDGNAAAIQEAANAHLKHGTTTIIPTSVASDISEVYQLIDCFQTAKRFLSNGPCLHGIHLEGPYLNKKQAGAQDPTYLSNPDPYEYQPIIRYADGAIVRWSVAPELPGALVMGDYLHSCGILPAIAHSDAEYLDVLAAVHHHYRLITHLYSGMSTITRKNGYRHLGVIESAYLLDDIEVEIIADGHHLPTELLSLIIKGIGVDRITLVTDAMRAAGCVNGEYILGSKHSGQKVIVEDGVAKLPDRSAFAGSVATADVLVRVMCKLPGMDIINAVKMITANPARVLHIKNKGSISVGMDADLVIFDDSIKIITTICSGFIHKIKEGV